MTATVSRSQPTIGHTPTPWAIRPNRFDDWGYIRGADGETACIARGHSDKDFDQHRRDKTDPYEANARLIVEAVNSHAALVTALEGCQQLLAVLVNPKDHPNTSTLHLWAQATALECETRAILSSHRSAKT